MMNSKLKFITLLSLTVLLTSGLVYSIVRGATYLKPGTSGGLSTEGPAYIYGGTNGLIVETGNVGIGTTNPQHQLHNWASSASQVNTSLENYSTGGAAYLLRTANTASRYIGVEGASPYKLHIGAGATVGSSAWMTLDSGNVGIGTTAPLSKLSVGGAGVANTGIYGYNSGNGVVGVGGVGVDGEGGVYGVFAYGNAPAATGLYAYGPSDGYNIVTGNSNSKNYFAGNVGIGTTNPSDKFDVAGALVVADSFQKLSGTIQVYDEAFYIGNCSGFNFAQLNAGDIVNLVDPATGHSEIKTMTSSQNPDSAYSYDKCGIEVYKKMPGTYSVGIGTTSPGAKLEVYTGNGTSGLKTSLICSNATTNKLYTDGGGNIVCGTDQTGGGSGNIVDSLSATLGAGNDASGINMVNIGNVGIGTSAPLSKLSVGGTGSTLIAIYGQISDAASVGVKGYSSGAGGIGVEGYGTYGGYFSGTSYGISVSSCNNCSVLAEMIPVVETPNNGDLMCINPGSGKTEVCKEDKSNYIKGIAQKYAETIMRMGCENTLDAENGKNGINIGVMNTDAWSKNIECRGWYPIALSGLSEETNVVCKTPKGKRLGYGDVLVSSNIPGRLRPLDKGEEVLAYQIAGRADSICAPDKETDSIQVWIN